MTEADSKIIWALIGARTGDNAQVLALAARLGARVETKRLTHNGFHRLPNLLLGASTFSLTGKARMAIAPPWPDMVIAAGKRSAPLARWIKRQSGDRTVAVHIGRPRAAPGEFDLIITTPQYGLPPGGNVVELPLPFSPAVSIGDNERTKWRAEWRELPRPLIAVALGAPKFPLRFGHDEELALAKRLDALGGSVLLIASPRTPPEAVARIDTAMKAPRRSYPWNAASDNPYRAALLEADRLVVTSDSISMLADLLSMGKRVDIFRLPAARQWWAWDGRSGIGAALSRAGLMQPPRDVERLVDGLIARGFAGELGSEREITPWRADYDEAVKRTMALLAKRSSQDGAA